MEAVEIGAARSQATHVQLHGEVAGGGGFRGALAHDAGETLILGHFETDRERADIVFRHGPRPQDDTVGPWIAAGHAPVETGGTVSTRL
jgi:hypothetical protein